MGYFFFRLAAAVGDRRGKRPPGLNSDKYVPKDMDHYNRRGDSFLLLEFLLHSKGPTKLLPSVPLAKSFISWVCSELWWRLSWLAWGFFLAAHLCHFSQASGEAMIHVLFGRVMLHVYLMNIDSF